METYQAERRAPRAAAFTGAEDLAAVVRHAIFLQACMGTAGAVEYLKAYMVDGHTIHRVLSGERVREGDRAVNAGAIACAT